MFHLTYSASIVDIPIVLSSRTSKMILTVSSDVNIVIPSMGPQLMFAAVMQIVSSFTAGTVAQNLVGFPSTDYKAHTIMTHAYDYGWVRYEMGYASAICMILFVVMYALNKLISRLLSKYMD